MPWGRELTLEVRLGLSRARRASALRCRACWICSGVLTGTRSWDVGWSGCSRLITSTISVITVMSSGASGASGSGCVAVPDWPCSWGVVGTVGSCTGWVLGSRVGPASGASGRGVGSFPARLWLARAAERSVICVPEDPAAASPPAFCRTLGPFRLCSIAAMALFVRTALNSPGLVARSPASGPKESISATCSSSRSLRALRSCGPGRAFLLRSQSACEEGPRRLGVVGACGWVGEKGYRELINAIKRLIQ